MTVRELLARIDSRELSEWMVYYRLEPWGTEVDDWRAGMIASVIANVNRDPKKQNKPFQPTDFMPRRAPVEDREQTEEEMLLAIWQIHARFQAAQKAAQKGGLPSGGPPEH